MKVRYLTPLEATRMIPRLERAFGCMMQLHTQIQRTWDHLDALGYAPLSDRFEVAVSGAPEEVLNDRAALLGMIESMRDEVARLLKLGCLVRDIERGVAAWLGRHQNRDIVWCWQIGESRVEYWHDPAHPYQERRHITELGDGRPQQLRSPEVESAS